MGTKIKKELKFSLIINQRKHKDPKLCFRLLLAVLTRALQ